MSSLIYFLLQIVMHINVGFAATESDLRLCFPGFQSRCHALVTVKGTETKYFSKLIVGWAILGQKELSSLSYFKYRKGIIDIFAKLQKNRPGPDCYAATLVEINEAGLSNTHYGCFTDKQGKLITAWIRGLPGPDKVN